MSSKNLGIVLDHKETALITSDIQCEHFMSLLIQYFRAATIWGLTRKLKESSKSVEYGGSHTLLQKTKVAVRGTQTWNRMFQVCITLVALCIHATTCS
jgi:hypothetical protein